LGKIVVCFYRIISLESWIEDQDIDFSSDHKIISCAENAPSANIIRVWIAICYGQSHIRNFKIRSIMGCHEKNGIRMEMSLE